MKVLGLWSGVGIVSANMIGAGVFLSAGFMAQQLRPGQILLAWLVGAFMALAGARAYATIARIVPRSGGEYRYLSDLLHPVLGYFAGWASLLVGFSAPIAIDAIAAGVYLQTLFPRVDSFWSAVGLITLLTGFHAAGLRWSKWTQNLLVLTKLLLVIGFITIGLTLGSLEWPQWEPPQRSAGFPLAAFAGSLFFIAFAFSGWNATAYIAEEFRSPRRDVPRAMLIGCSLVAILYLLVNWVLIANVTPERAQVVFNYEKTRITLGHVVTRDLLGDTGASLMSVLAVIAFVSAMSAMILAGPRVYAAMAADGLLPRVLRSVEGKPPVGSILLQGSVALLIVFTHTLRDTLQNVGAILTLIAAMTCLGLFAGPARRAEQSVVPRLAAAVFAASSLWMLYFGFRNSPRLLLWVLASGVLALMAYTLTVWFSRARLQRSASHQPTS